MYFSLGQPAGQWLAFSVLFGLGCMMMYVYYATVYSTIQDVIEPSLRATAMAHYFAAMYVFGGALGPTVIGKTSDYFANRAAVGKPSHCCPNRAAVIEGVDLTTLDPAAKLQYRSYGLNTALYALPVVS